MKRKIVIVSHLTLPDLNFVIHFASIVDVARKKFFSKSKYICSIYNSYISHSTIKRARYAAIYVFSFINHRVSGMRCNMLLQNMKQQTVKIIIQL